MSIEYREKRLEDAIEESLLSNGGYIKGGSNSFDRALALDTHTLLTFVANSQPKEWEKYEVIYGADSQRAFIDRFCKEVRQLGLIKVLREGIKDRGIRFKFVYFKPESNINENTSKLFEQNIFTCVRQLHYSVKNENSLDMVLL